MVGKKHIKTKLLDLSVKNNFETVKDGTGKPLPTNILNQGAESVQDGVKDVTSFLQDVNKSTKAYIENSLSGASMVNDAINSATNTVKDGVSAVRSGMDTVRGAIGSAISTVGNVVAETEAMANNIISSTIGPVVAVVDDVVKSVGMPAYMAFNAAKEVKETIEREVKSAGTTIDNLKQYKNILKGHKNLPIIRELAISSLIKGNSLSNNSITNLVKNIKKSKTAFDYSDIYNAVRRSTGDKDNFNQGSNTALINLNAYLKKGTPYIPTSEMTPIDRIREYLNSGATTTRDLLTNCDPCVNNDGEFDPKTREAYTPGFLYGRYSGAGNLPTYGGITSLTTSIGLLTTSFDRTYSLSKNNKLKDTIPSFSKPLHTQAGTVSCLFQNGLTGSGHMGNIDVEYYRILSNLHSSKFKDMDNKKTIEVKQHDEPQVVNLNRVTVPEDIEPGEDTVKYIKELERERERVKRRYGKYSYRLDNESKQHPSVNTHCFTNITEKYENIIGVKNVKLSNDIGIRSFTGSSVRANSINSNNFDYMKYVHEDKVIGLDDRYIISTFKGIDPFKINFNYHDGYFKADPFKVSQVTVKRLKGGDKETLHAVEFEV